MPARYKILIDEGLTGYGKMSGIGHFMVNLAEHLHEVADCDITQYPLLRKIPRYVRRWSYIATCNIPAYYRKYDLVHHMTNYVPWNRGKNHHILTVHDLNIYRFPETVSIAWRHYSSLSLRKSILRADAIITVSHAVREEILDMFNGVKPEKVFACYPGIRSSIFDTTPDEHEIFRMGLTPYSFFLFVGDMTKRKNLHFAITSFLQAQQSGIVAGSTRFVIVGKKAWGYREIRELINAHPTIMEMGYLSDSQIAALYRYTKAFIYPSIYEGFGSPLIEAMSQGAPILISDIPTSNEINALHNGQMFVFQLGDGRAFCSHLQRFDRDAVGIRNQLQYGDLSAYRYSNVAARHLAIYERVLGMAS
jgi:glycosyltransferase involved in cell wall biosynthesis